jgi:hypothetical protein
MHPAADEVRATDRVLGRLDGMGESQPLKPQIGRCRNALMARSTRPFARLFSPLRDWSRPPHAAIIGRLRTGLDTMTAAWWQALARQGLAGRRFVP